MDRSHYEVLGVGRTATTDELRRAYVALARESHPDRHVDANTADRRAAEMRMQQINEAWHVLGNARRRRRYDLETEPERRFATRTDGTMPHDFMRDRIDIDDTEEIDATTRIIRGLPWMVLIVVLFAIFVFTAYAATSGNDPTGACVQPDQSAQSGVVTVIKVACDSPNARHVVRTVDVSQPCPTGTERLQPSTGPIAYCLEV